MGDLSPYSAPKPPKTITQVKDDKFLDFTCLHTWILLLTIGSALYLFNLIARSTGVYQGGYVALLLAVIAIWLKCFSTFEKVDKQKLRVQFFIGDLQGKHVINKFAVPVTFLEKLVPIVTIHKGGIIEFKGKKFGVLMETFPLRIAEEERANHEKKIEKVINGIPTNTHFKTIACSRLEPRKPILRYLLEVTNKSNGARASKPKNKPIESDSTAPIWKQSQQVLQNLLKNTESIECDKARDLHLTDLYNKIAADDSKVISWKYYAFLSLGEWKTIEEARIQYGAIMPGLLKNMKVARLQPRVYTDENEISNAYRTMFNEMVV